MKHRDPPVAVRTERGDADRINFVCFLEPKPLIDSMIAWAAGGPPSDMQRYEGSAGCPAQCLMHRRRAKCSIPELLAWVFTKSGFRSRWRRADARERWNIWARSPTSRALSADSASVSGVGAARCRFVTRPGRAVMAFIASSSTWAIGATWWRPP